MGQVPNKKRPHLALGDLTLVKCEQNTCLNFANLGSELALAPQSDREPSVTQRESMLGAIIGDIVGSVYGWHPTKTKDFPFFADNCDFTDDFRMHSRGQESVAKRLQKKLGRMKDASELHDETQKKVIKLFQAIRKTLGERDSASSD